jgi:putative membrane protein
LSEAGEGTFPPATRRTYFAEERTLLAWWRTGITTAAVAVGIGGIVPHVSGLPRERFVALGVGYGLLALVFIISGSIRGKRSHSALAQNSFAPLPRGVSTGVTVYAAVLIVLTMAALF